MNGLSFTRSRTRIGALLLSLGSLTDASAVCAQTPLANGQVIKIDQAAGKITIKHGPLKQFGRRPGDADGCQTRRQNQIRARSHERPVRHHKNREGAMRLNSDRGHYVSFAVTHGAAERKRPSPS
jgi:hypothetical protein